MHTMCMHKASEHGLFTPQLFAPAINVWPAPFHASMQARGRLVKRLGEHVRVWGGGGGGGGGTVVQAQNTQPLIGGWSTCKLAEDKDCLPALARCSSNSSSSTTITSNFNYLCVS